MLDFILYTFLPLTILFICGIYIIKRFHERNTPIEPVVVNRQHTNRNVNRRVPRITENINRSRFSRTESSPAQTPNNNEDSVEVERMGTKKRAKLEAKAEKRAQREAEIKLREENKRLLEEKDNEQRQIEEEERRKEEAQELERKKLEEKKKKEEHERYLKTIESFTITQEGYEEDVLDTDDNMLTNFINHIKEKKVVMLEDLATTFHLKAQSVIDRIDVLQSNGTLTGVIDDRGKFIYITEDELIAVAEFVKKRGRVSIQELVENSNQLIVLNQC